jgi:hypothetical protein
LVENIIKRQLQVSPANKDNEWGEWICKSAYCWRNLLDYWQDRWSGWICKSLNQSDLALYRSYLKRSDKPSIDFNKLKEGSLEHKKDHNKLKVLTFFILKFFLIKGKK